MPSIETLSATPATWVLLAIAAFFVGLSKGGLPAIAMLSVPLLSTVISPLAAAALLLPIYILSDVIGVWLYRREYSLENLKILIPAGLCGVVIGWATASFVSDNMVALMIGVMGISFCLHRWSRNRKQSVPAAPADIKKGIFWGTLSGFTSFVSHAGAPPFQMYVLPQKLPKMVFAGTTTILFTVINLAKIIPYSQLQPYNSSTLQISLYLLPLAAIGTFVGKACTERLPEKWFFLAVQIALFLISVRLVLTAVKNITQ